MKTDRFTKGVLVVIATALATIACNQATSGPGSVAHAAGKFANVQLSGSEAGFIAFDSESGDVWAYQNHGSGIDAVQYLGKMTDLGKLLVKPATPVKN